MKRTLSRLLLALFILGGIAGLSAQTAVDQNLQSIHADWQQSRLLDGSQRSHYLDQLQQRVTELRQRYPERSDLLHWERIIQAERRPYG